DPIRSRNAREDRVSVAPQSFDPVSIRRVAVPRHLEHSASPDSVHRLPTLRRILGKAAAEGQASCGPMQSLTARSHLSPGPGGRCWGRCLTPTPLVTWKDHAEEGTGMAYGIVMAVAALVAQQPGGGVQLEKAKAQAPRAAAKSEAPREGAEL